MRRLGILGTSEILETVRTQAAGILETQGTSEKNLKQWEH